MVSACLLGTPCRYDGASRPCGELARLEVLGHRLIPVGPEVMGGLPTPRPPAELQRDGRVVDRAGKDSRRMTRAGADVTNLTNGAHAAVLENRPVTAEVLLEQVHDVDLILTEGYKHGPWKKIALYRAAVGKPFPCALEECMAVVTDTLIADCPAPCLGFDEIEALADRIEEEIGR